MHLNRRRFVRHSLSALAAAAASRPLAAAPWGSKSRPIGFSLYGMKSLPVAEAIDHCKRIGYDTIELCLIKDFPTELGKFTPQPQREVRARLRATGLELSSLLVCKPRRRRPKTCPRCRQSFR